MGLNEKKKREYLIDIIVGYLKTANTTLQYIYKSTEDTNAKKISKKAMKKCEEALVHINEIKHIEILEHIYNMVVRKHTYDFSLCGSLVVSPQLKYWDTDKGIEDFYKEKELFNDKMIREQEEKRQQAELIKKAKEENKKVEFVYDNDTKKLKPVILEEPKA